MPAGVFVAGVAARDVVPLVAVERRVREDERQLDHSDAVAPRVARSDSAHHFAVQGRAADMVCGHLPIGKLHCCLHALAG